MRGVGELLAGGTLLFRQEGEQETVGALLSDDRRFRWLSQSLPVLRLLLEAAEQLCFG